MERPEPVLSPRLLKERLRARAFSLGLHAFGSTTVQPDPNTLSRLLAAVKRGDLLTWGYDESWARKAADVQAHLPEAASVICVALAYAQPAPRERLGAGRISNYAWDPQDYHHRLGAMLDALTKTLVELTGMPEHLIICDTQPLAERAVAARAGVGWIGKHTNLIVPGVGSYVFLGEIVTRAVLPSDPPLKTYCGQCRRCVSACPTGALRGDYTLDARRCISDLTQRRGVIPRELRALMGTWLWGCDLCQEVCPPTRNAGYSARATTSRSINATPDLLEVLTLTRKGFDQRFRATALGWRDATLLRRNAAIALGNTLDRATVPELQQRLILEESENVRAHIAWALGRIGSPSATRGLSHALSTERNALVRDEMYAALSELP